MGDWLPNPELVERQLARVRVLCSTLQTLTKAVGKKYEDAYVWSLSSMGGSGEPPALGRGFQESDPTGQTATNGRLRELRFRTRKGAGKMAMAIALLEECDDILGDAFELVFDDEEWAALVAKRKQAHEALEAMA